MVSGGAVLLGINAGLKAVATIAVVTGALTTAFGASDAAEGAQYLYRFFSQKDIEPVNFIRDNVPLFQKYPWLYAGVEFVTTLSAGTSLNILNTQKNAAALSGAGSGSENRILTTSEAEEYAFNAIKGPDSADAVVLGKYESGSAASYDAVAKNMDAQYFNLDNWDELSLQYSAEEIWKINERFLDIETSSGRAIYLSHDPIKYIGGNSYYSKEIQYLINNGYRFIKEGDIWRAIR